MNPTPNSMLNPTPNTSRPVKAGSTSRPSRPPPPPVARKLEFLTFSRDELEKLNKEQLIARVLNNQEFTCSVLDRLNDMTEKMIALASQVDILNEKMEKKEKSSWNGSVNRSSKIT